MTAIVRDYGLVVITRSGSDPEKFIYESDLLTNYKVKLPAVCGQCMCLLLPHLFLLYLEQHIYS